GVRRAATGVVILLAGALVGGSPELIYRFRSEPPGEEAPSFGLASGAGMAINVQHAVAALPAYLNGDARARVPEGVSFAEGLAQGTDPHPSERVLPRVVAMGVDGAARAALVALLITTTWTAVAAWRGGNRCLLALCLMP